MGIENSIKRFFSRFINNGPFDWTSEYCVFDPRDPKEIKFIPIRKIKGYSPSFIYLHCVASETNDANIKDFRMTLTDKDHHTFKLDGKPIESEGIITKYDDGYTKNNYEENVHFMLEQAAKVLEIEEANKMKESFGNITDGRI